VSNRPSSKHVNGFPSDTASGRPPVQAPTSGHRYRRKQTMVIASFPNISGHHRFLKSKT